jgi:hypothetical protein
MKDKVLLTYAATNLLFLASGVLLLVFALTSQSNMNSTPKLGSVVRNLVLSETPSIRQSLQSPLYLSVGMSIANTILSHHRKCRCRLFHLPDLHSRDGHAHDKRLVEDTRVHDCDLCGVHTGLRIVYLV